jgi:DNA-binding transcriptional MerR regulator
MATISEVARMFDVDRDTVKLWTSKFADHLSKAATPSKGEQRQFNESDLRVLALVFYYWEDDPDYEHIHALLYGRNHETETFIEHARLHTPIFQEVPEEIEDSWHGAIIGGMAFRDRGQVARSYKLAADELVKLTSTIHEAHELDFPILFLYRHTVELYLKAALTNPPEHHDLGELSRLLEAEGGGRIPDWMRDRIRDFHEIDRMSSIFRYADPGPPGELWIDFHQLQVVIDKLVEGFEAYLASR